MKLLKTYATKVFDFEFFTSVVIISAVEAIHELLRLNFEELKVYVLGKLNMGIGGQL